jgi:hypothetical protein
MNLGCELLHLILSAGIPIRKAYGQAFFVCPERLDPE